MKLNFSIILHGCETQYFTLSKKHNQRVFKNGVCRKIFGSKMKGKRGGLRNVNNEMFQNLYSLPNIIKVIKSEFHHFTKTQFMPSYQPHILIILMWNKVTSHTFQARILQCKMWQKQKCYHHRQTVIIASIQSMMADVVWNKLFLIIANILWSCSYVNVTSNIDTYNTCTCNTNAVGMTWSFDVH